MGFHNEHHDFPRIPGSRLQQLHDMAPEFYKHLAHHDSYTYVIYRYVTDPAIGPFSRVKRLAEEARSVLAPSDRLRGGSAAVPWAAAAIGGGPISVASGKKGN